MKYTLETHIGTRKINEDYAICVRRKDGIYMFFVADGLGGHGKGDKASKFAAEYMKNLFLKAPVIDENFIRDAFEKTQIALNDKRKNLSDEKSMLTTGAVLICDDTSYQFGNVGDTRVYVFKDKKFYTHSHDHSIPQILVDEGKISDGDIRSHPNRSDIITAFGVPDEDFTYSVSDVLKYDNSYSFLLCTDGFWENLLETDMEQALGKARNYKKWISLMNKAVLKKSKKSNIDNYTSVVAVG